MVRLLLLSSPVLCLLSGIGISELLHYLHDQMKKYNQDLDKLDTYYEGSEETQGKKVYL